MCGIAGMMSFDQQPVSLDQLQAMCAAISHRGPDEEGFYVGQGVGLGIRRLSIIDMKAGHQPVHNEDGTIWVVFNGEIYNFRELQTQLKDLGHTFYTANDTEVIVHLYEEYGGHCVEHLRGMFAFALWDRRRRRLLAARDRIGKKPLFYAQLGGSFWFASEPRAILEDPVVPRDFDPHAIDTFLHYQYVHPPASAFAALRKLPPAHVLTWEDGRVTTSRY